MQTKIETEKEFAKTIDQLGRAQDKIESSQKEAKMLKEMLETYANENGVRNYKTESYRFAMGRGSQALKRKSGVCEASVIALLKKSSTMGVFVTESYDTAGIKAHVKNLDEKDEILDALGLYLTVPERHAEVRRIGA